jgi:hypothetical protein
VSVDAGQTIQQVIQNLPWIPLACSGFQGCFNKAKLQKCEADAKEQNIHPKKALQQLSLS